MVLFNLQCLRQDTPTNAIGGIGISKVSRTFCFSFLLCNAIPLLLCTPLAVHGYCTGDLHRRDIAGVWSLKSQSFLPTLHPAAAAEDTASAKQQQTEIRPLKEFTKWPKKKKKPLPTATAIEEEELLLMLRDDGSFIQYGKHRPGEDGEEIKRKEKEKLMNKPAFVSKAAEETVESFQEDGNDEEETTGVMKGTWDFIDGKLILAADRPEDLKDLRAIGHDTILSGDVVVKAEESLEDRSVIEGEKEGKTEAKKKDYGNNDDGSYDVHISVPEGTVEIGRFFYPKHHPSFFEQPIYSPTKTGSFQLRQVLGGLNTRTKKDDEPVEKFKVSDLQGKRYFLTTYPLKQRKPKRMADIDPHKREEAKRKAAEEEARPVPIRAVEIELFANMTFSTLGGLGNAKILRGKWNLIGENRDQLWMQVFRFGFGRAVSGSTYSEGMGLTHEDQKGKWFRVMFFVRWIFRQI